MVVGRDLGAYAVGKVSDQVLNRQVPCLELVVQPSSDSLASDLGTRRGSSSKAGGIPFGEGLLLHINPLLFDRQHCRGDIQGRLAIMVGVTGGVVNDQGMEFGDQRG